MVDLLCVAVGVSAVRASGYEGSRRVVNQGTTDSSLNPADSCEVPAETLG